MTNGTLFGINIFRGAAAILDSFRLFSSALGTNAGLWTTIPTGIFEVQYTSKRLLMA